MNLRGLRLWKAVVIAAASANLLTAGATEAADWSVESTISETAEFDDNIRLERDSPGAVLGLTTSPSIALHGQTRTLELDLNGGFDYSVFAGPGDNGKLDSFDQDAFAGVRRNGQRTTIGLSGAIRRQDTRSSEIEDTGETEEDNNKLSVSATSEITHRISPVDTVSLTGNFQDVSFENDSNVLTPHSSYSLDISWIRQFSSFDRGVVSAGATFFDADGPENKESQVYEFLATLTHGFSRGLTGRAGAGVSLVNSEFDDFSGVTVLRREDTSVGFLIDAGLIYELDNASSLQIDIRRDTQPSSRGEIQERTSIILSADRRFSNDLSASLAVRLSRQDSATSDSQTDSDRDFFRVEPRLTWQFLPDLSLSAAYRLRYQDKANEGSAISNALFFTLTYTGFQP